MNLFFELIQVALGTRDRLSRVPSVREWEALYDEAERQAIVGVLLDGLEVLPAEQLPPLEIKLQWIGEAQMIEASSRQNQKRAKELSAKMSAVGYDNCVLKGVAIAGYYPNPLRRQCGDIDLWVDGKRKDVMAYLHSQCEVGKVVWHHADVEFFEDVPVEIHFHPAWSFNPWNNSRLQKWFKAKGLICAKMVSGGYKVPSVAFNAVFALSHTFRHFLIEGVMMKHVLDYYYIINKLPVEDCSIVRETLKQVGLGKFAAAMMWVLHNVCGLKNELMVCKPNEKEGRFLLKEIMSADNSGQEGESEALKKNSLKRNLIYVKHYPSEILWVLPWRMWHWCWRRVNR